MNHGGGGGKRVDTHTSVIAALTPQIQIIPGVVGGTSFATIMPLCCLFWSASFLGCFCNISFIGAGHFSFNFRVASFSSSVVDLRKVW